MNKIFCSTGALIGRPNGRDFTLLGKCVRELECDGFEFMMYGSWHEKIDELRCFLSALPAEFPTFHIEKDVGNLISRNGEGDIERAFGLFDINCKLARELGSEKLVLHLWGGLDSDKDIANNISCYKTLRSISDSYNLLLTVENVVCNRADPMSHLAELAQIYPDIAFTFDTKMAQFHSQLPLLYRSENLPIYERVRHFHINDYAGGYMDWGNLQTLHIGAGNIDFESLFAFLKQKGYNDDFTVEATSFGSDGIIDFRSLNEDFARLREYIGQ